MKDKEDIEYFWVFLNSAWLFDLRGLPNFAVPKIEHRKFESVEIFCLSLLVYEIEVFIFFFLTVRNKSIMTYVKKQKVFML
jgi:hypothetical protein